MIVGLLVCLALSASFWLLLRARLLPVIVMRVWFTMAMMWCVAMCWAFTMAVNVLSRLRLIQPRQAEVVLIIACSIFFGVLRRSSPHIRVIDMPGSLPWSKMRQPCTLCMNHTSFFDVVMYMWLTPTRLVYHVRSFAKASLRKLPLFGSVIVGCGHFLVYFTKENSNSFAVDKEAQAQVMKKADDFLNSGGSLSFFPEGMLNRTPIKLRDFRLGSFNYILKYQHLLYYLVVCGNDEVWSPSLKGIPGFPADVYVYLGKYEYDTEHVDAPTLAEGLRVAMQQVVDEMIDMRERRNYVPWYRPEQPLTPVEVKSK